jgi:hypothetical protein
MNTKYVNALTGLFLGSCVLATTGCDSLKKMADEKLQEELKKDSKKKLAEDDDEKASGSAKAGGKPADGNAWTDAGGASSPLVRVKIEVGGLKGLSMMAPEGAEVKASLGGRGADVQKLSAGFAVWILEDGSVTLPLIKEAASAKYGKDSKVQHEDANSVIVGGKSALGDEFYAYMGFFKAPNGKTYRCETEQSQAGSAKSHAEAVDKLCESLELDGKAIGTAGGAAAPAEKVAENTPPAADPLKDPATKPAADSKPASTPASTPAKTSAPQPTQTAAPTQAAPPAPTQPAPTSKPTAKTPAPPPPAKKERTRK